MIKKRLMDTATIKKPRVSNEDRGAYAKGYKAFKARKLPSTCGYLNEHGDNPREIVAWMKGWSDAFEDEMSNWQK